MNQNRAIRVALSPFLIELNCRCYCSRPQGNTPSGGVLAAAGAPFTAIVGVRNLEGDLTPNYGNEIAPEGIKITASTLVAPAGGRNGTNNDGAIGNNRSFAPIAPSGSFKGENFDYQTAPTIAVTAKNAAGGTTQNYDGAWAKLSAASLTALDYDVATGSLSAGAPNAPTVTQAVLGVGSLTFNNGPQLSFLRSAPEAPLYADISLGLNVFDQDSVGSPSNPVAFGSATAGWGIAFSSGKELRYGRAVLVNAHGSDLLPLPVPLRTQYYDGAHFIDHTSDSCTIGFTANLSMTPNPGGLASTSRVFGDLISAQFQAGDGGLELSATGSGNMGYFDLQYDLTSLWWLRGDWDGDSTWDDDPASRATFGIYKGPDMLIYSREIY